MSIFIYPAKAKLSPDIFMDKIKAQPPAAPFKINYQSNLTY